MAGKGRSVERRLTGVAANWRSRPGDEKRTRRAMQQSSECRSAATGSFKATRSRARKSALDPQPIRSIASGRMVLRYARKASRFACTVPGHSNSWTALMHTATRAPGKSGATIGRGGEGRCSSNSHAMTLASTASLVPGKINRALALGIGGDDHLHGGGVTQVAGRCMGRPLVAGRIGMVARVGTCSNLFLRGPDPTGLLVATRVEETLADLATAIFMARHHSQAGQNLFRSNKACESQRPRPQLLGVPFGPAWTCRSRAPGVGRVRVATLGPPCLPWQTVSPSWLSASWRDHELVVTAISCLW